MNNYNILLASTDSAPGVLCNAASIVWQWNALVRGEGRTGKHFNQPPDAPYGSWYGYYKGPLEDPFSDIEQPACLWPEESPEAGVDSMIRPVPRAFLNRIRQILNSYPKGIPITTLHAELVKSNVAMDKDFFGHKKFSRLLLSLSTVLKLRPAGDGQLLVYGIQPNSAEPVESKSNISIGPETNDGDRDQVVIVERNGGDSAKTPDVDGKSSSIPQAAPLKFEEPPPVGQKENNEPMNISHHASVEKQDLTSELGIFHRICRTLFGHKKEGSNEKGDSIPGSTSDGSKRTNIEENFLESVTCPTSASSCSPSSSIATQSAQDENLGKDSGESDEKSGQSIGLFNKIVTWCRFWRTSGNPDNNDTEKFCKELKKRKELFSQDFFWAEIDLFIKTSKGSSLIFQSKTREQMAKMLQKEGPVVLNNLSENDLLQLVDLLISQKKWVEECPSQTYPFKAIRRASTVPSHLPGSNRLSSFLDKLSQSQSQSKLQGLPEHGMEKKDQNQFQPAACSTKSNKKPSGTGKARHEILADCQKLLAEILEEYPEGFNMGSFGKLFAERYGYVLDYQMLGYSKLGALLQVMPEAKIESTYILPAKKASRYPGPDTTTFALSMENDRIVKSSNSEDEPSDSARKDNDRESVWEELGPISETSSYRNDNASTFNGDSKKQMKEKLDLLDDCLSDDELSDWEVENVTLDQSERLRKSRKCEEESSLLQILDSWYSSKEDSGHNDWSPKVEEIVDCSRIDSKPSNSSGVEMKNNAPVANSRHKIRPIKKYSFVSEAVGDARRN
ncbi:uncharacterized protein LOC122071447 isoform X2 [Macadamia integrifolia]|nr:uncharacterized protein LOC122071447 isoform X2 [Macadamia integrifolia]